MPIICFSLKLNFKMSLGILIHPVDCIIIFQKVIEKLRGILEFKIIENGVIKSIYIKM